MQFIFTIGLALVTSLDSLGVGVAFGLNGTRIRYRAHLIISAVMLFITAGGVLAGHLMAKYLPGRDTQLISAILFIAVGIGMLIPMVKAFRAKKFSYSADEACDCCAVRAAEAAGQVRIRDAFGLGFLLSINNVGTGFSAGMMHLSPMAMAVLSVIFNVLCLSAGHKMGRLLRQTPVRSWAQILAASTMFAIGIYEFCQPPTF